MFRHAASLCATLWLWSLVPLLLGYLLVRLQLAPAVVGLALFGLGLLGWLLAALVAVAFIVPAVLSGSSVPWVTLVAAGSVLALVLAFVLAVGAGGLKAPLINDISTDTEDPPSFEAAKRLRAKTDNSTEWAGKQLADTQRLAYPELGPVYSGFPAADVYAIARQLVASRGWTVTADDSKRMLLEAVDRSPLWGFADDVVIRVTSTTAGARVDMRSASRVGKGDLGANAARIRKFLAELQASVKEKKEGSQSALDPGNPH